MSELIQLNKEFKINLDSNSSMFFYFSVATSQRFFGDPIHNYSLHVLIKSKEKIGIAEYISLIGKIKNILFVLADSRHLHIKNVICSKELTRIDENSDWFCEEHNVLFDQGDIISDFHHNISGETYKGLKHFCVAFKKLYENIEKYPDLFYELPNTNSERVIDNLVSLVKIIDNAYGYLCDTDKIPKKDTKLESELKKIFSGHNHEKEKDIIGVACQPNMQMKLDALIDSASILSARKYKNIGKIIKLSKDLRNKHSHGEIMKYFSKNKISAKDINSACLILRTAIYIQPFKKLDFDLSVFGGMMSIHSAIQLMHNKEN